MQRHIDRRRFLTLSGSVLGGIAFGTSVVAGEASDRWIVDTSRGGNLSGLEVIHDLEAVDLAVVRGSEPAVKRAAGQYASDLYYELQPPADGQLEQRYEADSTSYGKDKGKGTGKPSNGGDTSSSSEATDEPLYPLQWDKQALDIPELHDITRGEGTRVAIIDSGVGAGHPDLEHAVNHDLSRDFTGDGYGAPGPYGGYHGTHVAGIVAAKDQNDVGVVGTAPAAEIVDCRVFSPGQLASFGDILAAMLYSAQIGADVANLSLGAYPLPRQAQGSFYGKSLNRVTSFVNKEGTVLSIAAGNDSADLQHDKNVISLPNEGAQAVSVSATGPIGFQWDADGDRQVSDLAEPPASPAFYTNYGTNAIDIAAPGGDADLHAVGTGVPWYYDLVLNTIAVPHFKDDGTYSGAEHTYDWLAGTSMAAPQVSGAVAAVRSVHPSWGADQVEAALEEAATVPPGYDKPYYGAGFLNILDAL